MLADPFMFYFSAPGSLLPGISKLMNFLIILKIRFLPLMALLFSVCHSKTIPGCAYPSGVGQLAHHTAPLLRTNAYVDDDGELLYTNFSVYEDDIFPGSRHLLFWNRLGGAILGLPPFKFGCDLGVQSLCQGLDPALQGLFDNQQDINQLMLDLIRDVVEQINESFDSLSSQIRNVQLQVNRVNNERFMRLERGVSANSLALLATQCMVRQSDGVLRQAIVVASIDARWLSVVGMLSRDGHPVQETHNIVVVRRGHRSIRQISDCNPGTDCCSSPGRCVWVDRQFLTGTDLNVPCHADCNVEYMKPVSTNPYVTCELRSEATECGTSLVTQVTEYECTTTVSPSLVSGFPPLVQCTKLFNHEIIFAVDVHDSMCSLVCPLIDTSQWDCSTEPSQYVMVGDEKVQLCDVSGLARILELAKADQVAPVSGLVQIPNGQHVETVGMVYTNANVNGDPVFTDHCFSVSTHNPPMSLETARLAVSYYDTGIMFSQQASYCDLVELAKMHVPMGFTHYTNLTAAESSNVDTACSGSLVYGPWGHGDSTGLIEVDGSSLHFPSAPDRDHFVNVSGPFIKAVYRELNITVEVDAISYNDTLVQDAIDRQQDLLDSVRFRSNANSWITVFLLVVLFVALLYLLSKFNVGSKLAGYAVVAGNIPVAAALDSAPHATPMYWEFGILPSLVLVVALIGNVRLGMTRVLTTIVLQILLLALIMTGASDVTEAVTAVISVTWSLYILHVTFCTAKMRLNPIALSPQHQRFFKHVVDHLQCDGDEAITMPMVFTNTSAYSSTYNSETNVIILKNDSDLNHELIHAAVCLTTPLLRGKTQEDIVAAISTNISNGRQAIIDALKALPSAQDRPDCHLHHSNATFVDKIDAFGDEMVTELVIGIASLGATTVFSLVAVVTICGSCLRDTIGAGRVRLLQLVVAVFSLLTIAWSTGLWFEIEPVLTVAIHLMAFTTVVSFLALLTSFSIGRLSMMRKPVVTVVDSFAHSTVAEWLDSSPVTVSISSKIPDDECHYNSTTSIIRSNMSKNGAVLAHEVAHALICHHGSHDKSRRHRFMDVEHESLAHEIGGLVFTGTPLKVILQHIHLQPDPPPQPKAHYVHYMNGRDVVLDVSASHPKISLAKTLGNGVTVDGDSNGVRERFRTMIASNDGFTVEHLKTATDNVRQTLVDAGVSYADETVNRIVEMVTNVDRLQLSRKYADIPKATKDNVSELAARHFANVPYPVAPSESALSVIAPSARGDAFNDLCKEFGLAEPNNWKLLDEDERGGVKYVIVAVPTIANRNGAIFPTTESYPSASTYSGEIHKVDRGTVLEWDFTSSWPGGLTSVKVVKDRESILELISMWNIRIASGVAFSKGTSWIKLTKEVANRLDPKYTGKFIVNGEEVYYARSISHDGCYSALDRAINRLDTSDFVSVHWALSQLRASTLDNLITQIDLLDEVNGRIINGVAALVNEKNRELEKHTYDTTSIKSLEHTYKWKHHQGDIVTPKGMISMLERLTVVTNITFKGTFTIFPPSKAHGFEAGVIREGMKMADAAVVLILSLSEDVPVKWGTLLFNCNLQKLLDCARDTNKVTFRMVCDEIGLVHGKGALLKSFVNGGKNKVVDSSAPPTTRAELRSSRSYPTTRGGPKQGQRVGDSKKVKGKGNPKAKQRKNDDQKKGRQKRGQHNSKGKNNGKDGSVPIGGGGEESKDGGA